MKHDTRRYRDEHVSNERIFFFSIIRSAVTTEIDGAKDRRKEGGRGLREGSPPSSSKHVCAGWDRSKRNSSIPFDNSSLLNSSYSLVRLVPVERQSSCEAVRDRSPIPPSMPIKIVDGLIECVARLVQSPRKRRSISGKDNRKRNGQV